MGHEYISDEDGNTIECKHCGSPAYFSLRETPCTTSTATVQSTSQKSEKTYGGTKHDTGKVPLNLLPFEALEEVGKALAYGANKYSAHNWRSGFEWSRLAGALLRHVFAWMRGERKDPESGLSHLAHAACMLLFLLTHELLKMGKDDIPK